MLASGIYRIQNTVNGKVYIGSSKHALRRMQEHRRKLRLSRHHSAHLQSAWNLDGEDAFTFDLIVACAEQDLLLYEQRAIDGYQAHSNRFGYNAAKVAGSTRGFKHSDETRAAYSAARAGRKRSTEWIANMSASRMGKKRPADVVEKTRQANLGKKRSLEIREMISKHRTGSKASEATRKAMSESRIGRKHSAESIAKMKEKAGRKPAVFVLVDGMKMSVKDAAVKLGIHIETVRYRLKHGALTAAV